MNLTVERLREVLDYDAASGIFRWKVSTGHRAKVGGVAGGVKTTGYHRIIIDRREYLSHRLAWLYAHGYWPSIVDHINGNKLDNRIQNLRIATATENAFNRGAQRNSKSGHKGVHRHTQGDWCAQIKAGSVRRHLGLFKNLDDARAAYAKAAFELHGQFVVDGANDKN